MDDVTDGADKVPSLSMLEVLRYRLILVTLPQLTALNAAKGQKC